MVERQESNLPPASSRKRFRCPSWLQLNKCRRSFVYLCERLIHSAAWKTVMLMFTVLLLFGSPVQTLYVPMEFDPIFDYLYMVTLGVFIFDMTIHFVIDPDYFRFKLPSCFCCRQKRKKGKGKSSSSGGERGDSEPSSNGSNYSWGIGSFKFWCDFFSTAMLVFDISYFYPHGMAEVTIQLNDYGIPDDFPNVVNQGVPYDADLDLLIVVAKTARVARLIRSATVVEIASRINFYWYYEHLNPWWYWNQYKENKERQRRLAEEAEEKKRRERRGLLRRASWGALEVATRAAVKTHALDGKLVYRPGRKIRGALKRTGRFLGVLPEKNLELRRHIAATKIQRAWKKRVRQPTGVPSDDGAQSMEDEPGWGRGRANALDRVLKKRSMMGLFQSQHSRISRKEGDTNDSSGRNNSNPDEDNRPESQVGNAMGELTGQRVALGILFTMILTTVFSYQEDDATRPATMIVMHGQLMRVREMSDFYKDNETGWRPLSAARKSTISELFEYNGYIANNATPYNFVDVTVDVESLRKREQLRIEVEDKRGTTKGKFVYRQEREDQAVVVLASTVFVLVMWFLGVTAFAGPVMTLVIIPIERMVRLLGMLMLDPLGYQSTSRFKKFLLEEDKLVKNSQWTKDVLKGMETSFLMSTILRIGSLMKVGFGSAGVEIIRNNLQSGQNNNMLILNSQGSMVACIFLFCDIRQFTDATECLQEEVFVFTNRIAAVVHSICNAYGGSANKNVGDAFLMSWLLDDQGASTGSRFSSGSSKKLKAKNNQADKALLSVVRICIALQYNDYYVQTMSDTARNALLNKIKNRPGPVVQMGFGLHAGEAVQGAIGSQRKIDATYVSEAVERAEFLESSTKQYGVKMLMSDSFHRLLHPGNRRRCRKVDQIIFQNEDEDGEEEELDTRDVMELFTYDMDVEALWRNNGMGPDGFDNNSDSESVSERGAKKDSFGRPIPVSARGSANLLKKTRRLSMRRFDDVKGGVNPSDELKSAMQQAALEAGAISGLSATEGAAGSTHFGLDKVEEQSQVKASGPGELVLPTRTAIYSSNIWVQEDMRRIRHQYTHVIFRKFSSGLQAFYQKDWTTARQCFGAVLERFPDGPSRYFMDQIEKHNGVPPRDFMCYGSYLPSERSVVVRKTYDLRSSTYRKNPEHGTRKIRDERADSESQRRDEMRMKSPVAISGQTAFALVPRCSFQKLCLGVNSGALTLGA